ncbi:hypothetical protein [Yoonia sp. MH D7]
MTDLISIERIVATPNTSAVNGEIVFSPFKSVWLIGHAILGLIGIVLYPQYDAFLVFVLLTAVTVFMGSAPVEGRIVR